MTTFTFIVTQSAKITVEIPNVPEKFNYYYEPTEKLHQFDEAKVFFITPTESINIRTDTLDEIFYPLYIGLKKTIKNELSLPPSISPENIGVEFNKMLYNTEKKVDFYPYWIWSIRHIQTLLYNYDKKIYLTILPNCPDIYADKPDKIIEKSFNTFIKNFKPYFAGEISHKTAKEWLKQCEEILLTLGYNKTQL